MQSTSQLQASGLNVSDNSLSVGSNYLIQADNVIIKRNNVIESRRGFPLYGNSFGTETDRASQLFSYKNRILRHYNDVIQFDNGSGVFTSFFGSFPDVVPGLRMRSIEANGNLYLTTANGIEKLSARTAADFTSVSNLVTQTGTIIPAGGVNALGAIATLDVTLGGTNGILPQDSAAAYRIVWGTTDANGNLILGSPSAPVTISNPLTNLIVGDLLTLLQALDNLNQTGSLITNGDYVATYKLPVNATADQLRTNILGLVSELDSDIQYTNGTTVQVSTSQRNSPVGGTIIFSTSMVTYISVGDLIVGSGFFNPEFNNNILTVNSVIGNTVVVTPAASFTANDVSPIAETVASTVNSYNYVNIANEVQGTSVSSLEDLVLDTPPTDQEIVVIQNTLFAIMNQLKNELSGVIPTVLLNTYIIPLSITTSANVILTFPIPAGITPNYFYQVYRSAIVTATGTTSVLNLVPGDEMQLVFEAFPTSAQLALNSVSVVDITPPAFAGAFLYTNENSGEGILQANDIPPVARDINRFKNVLFFANTSTRFRMSLSLLGISKLIQDFNMGTIPSILITNGVVSNLYTFTTGVNEETTLTVPMASSIPASGYFDINSANDTDMYRFWYDTTGTDPAPAADGKILIKIELSGFLTPIASPSDVANRTSNVISQFVQDFASDASGNQVTIENVLEGYTTNASLGPGMATAGFSLSIVDGRGQKVTAQSTQITTVHDVANSLAGTSVLVNEGGNQSLYYFWFRVSGSGADPMIAGRTGLVIDINTNDSAATIATEWASQITSTYFNLFQATAVSNVLTLTNNLFGSATSPSNGPLSPGFTYNVIEPGALQILLSNSVSPAIAVSETTQSLIDVVNLNMQETIYAYSLSTSSSVPGLMNIQSRTLNDLPFYIVANNSNTGTSFSPDLSPEEVITNISIGSPTTVTVSTPHNLLNGDQVIITDSNSFPSIDGIYTVSNITPTTFQIPVQVLNAGTTGQIISTNDAQIATNDVKPNRIYYSKISQPDAVPLVNFVDVGAEDSAILRIFPLRESLFVFKEDGLFRLSGEQAPWTIQLFDSSIKIIAPDSVDVSNNLIYGWSKQGIMTVSESGGSLISRPIDTIVLPIGSDQYPNFSTATWGVGYESDNSYMVFTVSTQTDTLATQCYRYSNLTNSWTRFAKTDTCGVVNTDERLYLGAGDINFLEQERKSFDRTDYADREFSDAIGETSVFQDGLVIKLPTVSSYGIGDVITQVQTLTVFQYNSLLQKLDMDPSVAITNIISSTTGLNPLISTNIPNNLNVGNVVIISGTNSMPSLDGTYKVLTTPTSSSFTIQATLPVTVAATSGVARMSYYGTLLAVSGDDMRTDLLNLASKLDGDPNTMTKTYESTIATQSGTIVSNTDNLPTVVTTASNHNLFTGRIIAISGSNSIPSINGDQTVTVTGPTTFTLPINILTAGTTGTYATEDNNFSDLLASYNKLISLLNTDTGVTFGNYNVITTTTLQEATITAINTITRKVTMDIALDWIVGPVIVFNAINTQFTYAPNVLGDPLTLKQVSEATMMFQDKAFSSATMSFSTDLQPEFLDTTIVGDGKGLFGFAQFGTGYFGGGSNGVPFRTYIPRPCQRCRYILLQFTHDIAREKYAIYGSTLSGRTGISTRAYR